jgi:soluble lytic murein transglycosylase-like protein
MMRVRLIAFIAFASILALGVGADLRAAESGKVPGGRSHTGTVATQPSLRSLVSQVAYEFHQDPRLIDAVVRIESGYNPRAVSKKGAMGLMQLMPATAKRLRVSDPFDPRQNLRAGVKEFARLVDRYAGDLPLALAAYNAGENAVARYNGIPPYRETRNYVKQIMTIYTGRTYSFAEVRRRMAPVRLTQNPHSGELVITNQEGANPLRKARSASTGKSRASVGRVLAGGFGK